MASNETAIEELFLWIDPEVEDLVPANQDLFDFAIAHLHATRRSEALTELEDMLATNPTDKGLEKFWFRNGARVGVVDIAGYRILLDELRRRLKGEQATFRF